jgi:hypothetical protein
MNHGTQQGPMSKELLISYITTDTMIWCNGMTNWTKAGDVPEIASLLGDRLSPEIKSATSSQAPPPPVGQQSNPYASASSANKIHMQGPPPKNWLVESILVTLFCCIPFGIAGIVHASKVENLWYMGDHTGAYRAADNAKKWTKVGFFTTLILGILYLIFIFAVVGFANLKDFR